MLIQIKQCPIYFGLLSLMLVVLAVYCCLFSKLDIFIALNSFHWIGLDYFFRFYTYLGDGICSMFVILLFAGLKKKRIVGALLFAFIVTGILVYVMKSVFSAPRPNLYFQEISFAYHHFVAGVSLYNSGSFPSGHTATAFAMATVLTLFSRKQKRTFLFFLAALLVGYSRIYLAQHFLLDVIVGMMLGALIGMFSFYMIVNKKFNIRFNRNFHKRQNAILRS
ncbi:phosphatase PAP2 family protein [Pedobacter hiemivivus]|uniref:Phosphatase PAP2 family protein n=2 Tax=Pedobacter hiemivivus TaxID=2530454 RepID=A0A4U1GI81_9SPHI|nr:phosphatase PAP2 family protein [Pedobacter hiemivivus]